MIRRNGFTFIELIFVVVIMGFLSKYGIEFLARAYDNFIFSNLNNSLQSKSATAVEEIGSRLQFRIKDSIIARDVIAPVPSPNYQALASSTFDDNATVLEWVGVDIDGLRGDTSPTWSGIIDLYNAGTSTTTLITPDTNFTAVSNVIDALSYTDSSIADAAIYFIGSDSNINQYGWNGAAITDHNTSVIHPITSTTNNQFTSSTGVDFNGTDIYEYYQLAWTAYAVAHEDGPDTDTDPDRLVLYYDYQPWNGQDYNTSGKSALLMEDVDTFRFKAIGSIVKIQVCVNTDLVEDYSLCKEKTIY